MTDNLLYEQDGHVVTLPLNQPEMCKSWPTIRFIARLERRRDHVRRGCVTRTERKTIYLITSLPRATPKRIVSVNRSHRRIETMHRDKDVTFGEDRHTNRLDHAPQDIFTLTSATRTVPKRISNSPTRAIETFQTSRTTAIRFLAKGHNNFWAPLKTRGLAKVHILSQPIAGG